MMKGFGNHFSTEAVAGALPVGRNSPQKVPFGLYAEQFSGTAFTAPRAQNRRSWLYRLHPSAMHPAFEPYKKVSFLKSGPFDTHFASPNRLRWSPLEMPRAQTDFVDGLITMGGNGDVNAATGIGIHLYACNNSMKDRAFFSSDGELLIVPQEGELSIRTEMGAFTIAPLQVAVIPRGLKFRVEVKKASRGYVAENYGQPLRLPELGPIGANGLANPRDFETPEASFEDLETRCELVQKFQGKLWTTHLAHSPFDVVAWHGNLVPYVYDLRRFNTVNSVSFDHMDPSIFTVLTSPSDSPGTANFDFVIFPPRWMVAEDTFRPPWFHRNVASEFMGLIVGQYDAKEGGGFVPGGASLHNCMNGHGPDRASYEKAIEANLKPVKIDGTMAFMFETRAVIVPSEWAMTTPTRQLDYDDSWAGFKKAEVPKL